MLFTCLWTRLGSWRRQLNSRFSSFEYSLVVVFFAEKTDNKKMAKCAINFLYCSRHLFINGARPRIHFAAAAANGGEMEWKLMDFWYHFMLHAIESWVEFIIICISYSVRSALRISVCPLKAIFLLKESVQFNMISFSLHWPSRVKLVFTENRKKRVSSNFSHFLASQQRKGRKKLSHFHEFWVTQSLSPSEINIYTNI